MSKESAEWLNNYTLIGFTEKRGEAWHYQASLQGDEPNHYPGAVPVEDVERRLFDWEAEKEPLFVQRGDRFIEVPKQKAVSASDDIAAGIAKPLGYFTDGYEPHQYRQWLLKNVSTLLDGELAIGSAGLLQERAQAWVSIEVPENIKTPEGVEFRPNLVAATSFNGSLATTYCRTCTIVRCDNTLHAGLSEEGQKIRLKHTRYSTVEGKVDEIRSALEIVYDTADDFAAEVARLCEIKVSKPNWDKLLDIIVPVEGKEKRGLTLAEKKRDELIRLYSHDDRVAPWKGNAFGVLQAFNTYEHHFATIKGASKVQRNREAALTGSIAKKDALVLQALATVGAA